MVDPAIVPAKIAFARILNAIADRLSVGGARQVRDLKDLADKKLSELADTHKYFLGALELLKRQLKASTRALRKARNLEAELAKLEKSLEVANQGRFEESETRRAQFEEAKVYAEREISERGVFRFVPDDTRIDVMVFMEAYCSYFRHDSAYRHELSRALFSANVAVNRIHARLRKSKRLTIQDRKEVLLTLERVVEDCEVSQQALRANWANVAASYHLLNKRFRSHGLSTSSTGEKRKRE